MIIYYIAIEKYTEGSYKFMFLYFFGEEASEVTQYIHMGRRKEKRGERYEMHCAL